MYGYYGNGKVYYEDSDDMSIHCFYLKDKDGKALEEFKKIKCPYGKVGDVLWLRESFFDSRKFKTAKAFESSNDFLYKAEDDFIGCHKWKPSIHMPKEACRLFLKITDIRVERLHDVNENDAVKEGIKNNNGCYECYQCDHGHIGIDNLCEDGFFKNPISSFQSLWKSINGEDSWNLNPWVWVIEFERIDKPVEFI